MAIQTDFIRRKLVIVGDGNCGKTSLLSVFTQGYFPREYFPTVFENHVKDIVIDGKAIQLALWDTAGQEEYERIRPHSYVKADVILIAYAMDSPDSLENVAAKWIEEVNKECPKAPVLLIGCKKDLRDGTQDPLAEEHVERARSKHTGEARYVQHSEAEEMARNIGATNHLECSALTGEGIDNVFEMATRAALLNRPEEKSNSGCCIIL
ncbi:small GTPase superfamily [Radiomyces spectabilis]|uniref:small GTPase superfamily n=1 Tax=Radiomyces spectabilis TaxID=64574 RepID=UPI00222039B4|nr:small GTPase superfamily [Radiomyces spectabilis]KAI8381114.1 small GTPase superfamily [Radiomyces spectabilis]